MVAALSYTASMSIIKTMYVAWGESLRLAVSSGWSATSVAALVSLANGQGRRSLPDCKSNIPGGLTSMLLAKVTVRVSLLEGRKPGIVWDKTVERKIAKTR